jgi:hypothetical protein
LGRNQRPSNRVIAGWRRQIQCLLASEQVRVVAQAAAAFSTGGGENYEGREKRRPWSKKLKRTHAHP